MVIVPSGKNTYLTQISGQATSKRQSYGFVNQTSFYVD